MFQAQCLFFEIALLTAMISTGEQPSQKTITVSRQSDVNEAVQEDEFRVDESRENSAKRPPRHDDSNRFHNMMMDDDDPFEEDDEATSEQAEKTTLPAWMQGMPRENRRKPSTENAELINEMEAQFLIHYDLTPLDIGHERSRKLIASSEMIERITWIQKKLVQTRARMLKSLLDRASKVTTDIEYTFTKKHSCSVQMFNELILRDWPLKYPYGLLNMVRSVKEALLKSRFDKIPIATVDESVYKRLEFALNRLGERLMEHGKLVYKIFEELVVEERRAVRTACQIPRRPLKIKLEFEGD